MTLAAIKPGLAGDQGVEKITVVLIPSLARAFDEIFQLVIVHPLLKEVLPPPPVRSLFSISCACHVCSALIRHLFFFMTPP
jgi:hypothetical protein